MTHNNNPSQDDTTNCKCNCQDKDNCKTEDNNKKCKNCCCNDQKNSCNCTTDKKCCCKTDKSC